MFKKLFVIILVGTATFSLCGQSVPYGKSTFGDQENTAEIKQKIDSLNNLSDVSIDSSYSAAYAYSLQALKLSESIQYDSGKILSLLSLGRYFAVNRKYVTAFDLFFNALSLSTATSNIRSTALVNFRIGQTFNTIKDQEKAIEYITKSLDISYKLHDTVYILENMAVLGFATNSFKDGAGDKYFYLALGLAEKIHDSARIRTCYRNLGILYNSRNDHSTALYFYQKALRIMSVGTPNYDIGALYSLIAHEWQQMKEYEKCLQNHHLALAIRLKQNRAPMYISSLLNIGNLFMVWEKYDSSFYYLQTGLSMLKDDEFLFLQQYGYRQLYSLYEKLGNSKKALEAFQRYTQATENLLKESNRAELSYFESNFVLYQLEEQNRELQNALEIQKFRTRSQLFLSLLFLSILSLLAITFFYFYYTYRKNKRSKQHLEKLNKQLDFEIQVRIAAETSLKRSEELYRFLAENSLDGSVHLDHNNKLLYISPIASKLFGYDPTDTINLEMPKLVDPEYLQHVSDTFMQFVTTKQPGKIQYLAKRKDGTSFWAESLVNPLYDAEGKFSGSLSVIRDVSDRVSYEKILAENAHQKELLLREIHHRVKNNFAILVSLMTLQKISSENEELHNLIDELQIRVRTMSLVHELLYRSDSLDVIPFARYLDQLLNIVSGTYSSQRISMIKDIDDCTLNISIALPLGLIVNELLTNSFKYAFPGNPCSELHITLKPVETDLLRKGNWKLTIKDNGPGLPENFDLDTAGSLGSQIVRLLIEQIEGEIFISNENGACFTILFNDKMN